ncbi:MAG TPA: pyruvate kinase [Gammaproteobacteria bacterium]
MLPTQGAVPDAAIESLLHQLLQLRARAVHEAAARLQPFADDFPGNRFTASALNLTHYLALRSQDLRPLQDQLAALGLSSLGRGEAHILDNLNRVIDILNHDPAIPPIPNAISGSEGRQLLERHAQRVFGRAPSGRTVRIMVTLPGSAATDGELMQALLAKGMDCARINCAHDDSTVWAQLIATVRNAERATGRTCSIFMDLAGQKVRTGPIETLPGVQRIRPGRDRFGVVVRPAQVRLWPDTAPVSTADILRVPPAIHAELQPGDRFSFADARGKRRYVDIDEVTAAGEVLAHCWQSTWLRGGIRLAWQRRSADGRYHTRRYARLGEPPEAPGEIRLAVGDCLLLTEAGLPGRPAQYDIFGRVSEPARLGCSHAGILSQLKAGHEVWLDDGKVGARVENVGSRGALLRITHARRKGTAIQADKGINFPDLPLAIPPLTEKDLCDLDFIVRHADAVGYSFVQRPEDMRLLIRELERRGAAEFPIVAKIETRQAVTNLPGIILSGIGRHPLGVMIARGDLAVEIGSARLAEIQEEILWLCEAAHVPVVWATQVLETMTKKGLRSRPELTDAAMGVRAECVMLNKGPYILDALDVLNSILTRMEAHQRKKHSRLRALHW